MDTLARGLGPDLTPARLSESDERAAEAPHVVIVGAGFGGMEAAKALARAPIRVTLIDRVNHHCFQPLLYQVATGALSPADIAWPVRSIFSRQRNAQILMAEVTGVDTHARAVVLTEGRRVAYDYLILATGATHSYFGHEEWSPAAPALKRIEDATGIRRRLLLAFERAELEDDEAERRRLMTFIVVGGGPTGVEMAGGFSGDVERICATRPAVDGRGSVDYSTSCRIGHTRRDHGARQPHRGCHRHMGGRRNGIAGRSVDIGCRRSGRTDQGRAGPVGARPPGNLRDRRYRLGTRTGWQAGAGACPGRQADGAVCGTAYRGAGAITCRARRLSLPSSRRSRDDRAQTRRRFVRPSSSDGLHRLGVLERGPHFLPNWRAKPRRGGPQLDLGVPDVATRRPPDPWRVARLAFT